MIVAVGAIDHILGCRGEWPNPAWSARAAGAAGGSLLAMMAARAAGVAGVTVA